MPHAFQDVLPSMVALASKRNFRPVGETGPESPFRYFATVLRHQDLVDSVERDRGVVGVLVGPATAETAEYYLPALLAVVEPGFRFTSQDIYETEPTRYVAGLDRNYDVIVKLFADSSRDGTMQALLARVDALIDEVDDFDPLADD